MPWVIGVDEAGYGPNLGPLVQTAVGLWLPDDDPAGWTTLQAHVRQATGPADGRLLIDDSKRVYTRGGFAALERGVHAVFGECGEKRPFEACFRPHLLAECWQDLLAEAWFLPRDLCPVTLETADALAAAQLWQQAYGGEWAVRARLVPAPRFNRIVAETNSKATVLAQGLIALLAEMQTLGHADAARATDSMIVLCDKQGGRNYYASLLQTAFPDGWVNVEKESAAESRYRVAGLSRDITVLFRPRADAGSVCVALASMVCKYLREVCMAQFNRFWATHVPGLKPTAGYPVDARRFYDAIEAARLKLGLTDHQVWRCR